MAIKSAWTLAAAALLLGGGASAQSQGEKVWGSVAFIYHGERQPLQLTSNPALTPLGAQQMQKQGAIFRARYLLQNDSTPQELTKVTSEANIQGLERNAIDNTQLTILTGSDGYMSPSAMAFVQGLYPPMNQSVARGAGGMDSAELRDGSLVNFPLGGYQYPRIQTLASSDPESTWIQGHAFCTQWAAQGIQMRGEQALKEIDWEHANLYRSVWAKLGSPTPYSPDTVNFFSASRIYDFALYNYTHENASRSVLSESEIAELEALAARQQLSLNGNLSAYGKTPGDNIRAIGGRMLAGKVAAKMRAMFDPNGWSRLTLIFGTLEPLVGFFALSSLTTTTTTKPVFERLPHNGAAMVFEAFTAGDYPGSSAGAPPSESDLWVRFLYRNGTDPDAQMVEYPLFGDGNSQRHMRFPEFLRRMDSVGVTSVAEWCRLCDSTDLFCPAYGAGGNPTTAAGAGGDSSGLPAAAAGAIGVIATFSFISLATAVAVLCGGLRFTRRADAKGDDGRRRSLGGFKGPEKRENDPDVVYARGGVRHERTGSWELRGGGGGGGDDSTATTVPAPAATAAGAGSSPVGATFARSRREDEEETMRKDAMLDDDDTARLFHATPVQPRSSL